jgi:hypothetical protein
MTIRRFWVPSLGVLAAMATVLVVTDTSRRAESWPPGAATWPYTVWMPAGTQIPALSRLKQLHDQAAAEMAAGATGDTRTALKQVIDRTFTCAAWDGYVGTSGQPHSQYHMLARNAVWAAYQEAFFPTTGRRRPDVSTNGEEIDWPACAAGLDHAHPYPATYNIDDWPHLLFCVQDPALAWDRLSQLHAQASQTLYDNAAGTPVSEVVLVLQRTFDCAAFDSYYPSGTHLFHTLDPTPHAGAVTALWDAYSAVFDPQTQQPLASPDWAACATGLNHGHP